MPLNQPGHWKWFISYKQDEAATAAEKLCNKLGGKDGKDCWLDSRMEPKSVPAMKEGVINSEVFLAILTPGYFASNFCRNELKWAREYDKKVVTCYPHSVKFGDVLESMDKEARGEFDWVKEIDSKSLVTNDDAYFKVGIEKIKREAGIKEKATADVASVTIGTPVQAASTTFGVGKGDRFDYAPWGGACVASWQGDELWMRRETQPSTDGSQIWKTEKENGGGRALLRGEEVNIRWDNNNTVRAQMRDNTTIVVWHGKKPYEFRRL